MKFKITELRKIIRTVITEVYESDEEVYDDTVLPGDEADDDLLAEPDLTDQKDRDDYVASKQKKRTLKARLQSAEEIDDDLGDEHAIAGHIGPLGASGNGPGNKPYGKQKKLRSKNAMSNSGSIDEYDE